MNTTLNVIYIFCKQYSHGSQIKHLPKSTFESRFQSPYFLEQKDPKTGKQKDMRNEKARSYCVLVWKVTKMVKYL